MIHMIVLIFFATFTGGEVEMAEDICSSEIFVACLDGADPDPPVDWDPDGDRERVEFCEECVTAWFSGQLPTLEWFMIPVVMGLSLFLGWVLTKCVELPCQDGLRGEEVSCCWPCAATVCCNRKADGGKGGYEPIVAAALVKPRR